MQIEYDYLPVPTVKEFSKDNNFIRGLMGPFGSGKSSGCVIEILRRAQAQAPGQDGIKRTRWAIIRNTYGQLKDTTIKTFHQWVPPNLFGEWRVSDHTYIIKKFKDCEIEILFRALDRPEHVSNLLSLELTGAWVNEAREVPWLVIQALQGRVGRFPAQRDGGPTWFGVFMDTNPPDEDSWWYRQFEEVKPEGWAIFKQPSGRSPTAENLKNLPKGYYDNLINSMDEETVKVYVDGQYGYTRDGKPVYPEYNDNLHCKSCSPIKGKPIYRGWDFGLTPACSFSQVLPSGRWIIFDEMTSESMGIERFSEDVIEHCNQEYKGFTFIDVGDPAGNARAQTDEKTCFEILRGKKVLIQSGEQSLAARLESVRKPLRTLTDGKPRFVLDPKCKMLRKGFQGRYKYRRLQVSSERYSEEPDKNDYSHIHDSLQYVATRLFYKSDLKNSQVKKGPSKQPKIKVL